MQTYVNFLESAGARVVPLLYNSALNETHEILNKLNGVLFPGGICDNDKKYSAFSRYVFDYAKD